MAGKIWRIVGIVVALLLVVAAGLQIRSCYEPLPKATKTKDKLAGKETPYHAAGADCAKCHMMENERWADSLHAATATDVLLNEEHNKAELLVDDCIGCHSPFQTKEGTIGAFVGPIDQKGPWHLNRAASKWEAIKCQMCHRPSDRGRVTLAFYDHKKGRNVTLASVTQLCEKCHEAGSEDSRDLKGSVHQGLECNACHLRGGMDISAMDSCKMCHPKVDPWGHPGVAGLDTTYRSLKSSRNIHFISCNSCHFCSTCHKPRTAGA